MSYANAMRYLQKNIFDYARPGVPYEVISALIAARGFNQYITEADLGNGAGKKRPLKINYSAPICDDDGTCSDNICEAGIKVEPQQAWFEIARCTASAVYTIAKDDLRYIDGEWRFSQDAMRIVRSMLPAVHKKWATELTALLVQNVGLQPNGAESAQLPLVDKNNGTINPMGLWNIEKVYRNTGYSDPFIIGGDDAFYWKRIVNIGGLNELGQNVAQMGRSNVYYEPLVNTAFADPTLEHIITFDPQMLKLVTFSENAGMFATELDSIQDLDTMYARGGTDYIEGILVDPTYGIIWDFNATYDKCEKVFNLQIKLNWDLFFMPAPVCNIQGVNGIYHFTTCLPAAIECPTPASPVSVPSATFTWDTSPEVAYPLFVHKLEAAGITTYPDVTVANTAELRTLMTANIPGYVFGGAGTNVTYNGYTEIAGQINDSINMSFS